MPLACPIRSRLTTALASWASFRTPAKATAAWDAKSGCPGVKVQRAEVVAFDIQLQRQHARRPGLTGSPGELRPPGFARHVSDADGQFVIGRVQTGPLLRFFLEGVDLHREVTGGCLGADAP